MRRFPLWILLAALTIVVLMAGCSNAQPDIDLPSTFHDFGEVDQGDVVTVELAVLNKGQADLHIESVSTSCGCTTASVQPQVIPAGSQGTLTVSYDSGLHPDSGSVRRFIYIASNDPDEAEVEVEVVAKVLAP
ncbi:MAG: DUF1573 domain-containing protein [Anaerolineae bacterium]